MQCHIPVQAIHVRRIGFLSPERLGDAVERVQQSACLTRATRVFAKLEKGTPNVSWVMFATSPGARCSGECLLDCSCFWTSIRQAAWFGPLRRSSNADLLPRSSMISSRSKLQAGPDHQALTSRQSRCPLRGYCIVMQKKKNVD